MLISYEPEADQLTFTWAAGDAPEWRRARRDLHVLVDYDGEPLGVSLQRAAQWHVPELRDVADAAEREIDLRDATPPERAHAAERLAAAIASALTMAETPSHWQPQLPWDDPIPAAAQRTYDRSAANRARGICAHCGSVAPVRQAPVKRCGWPLATWCGCAPIPAAPAQPSQPPAVAPADGFSENATWSPAANRIATSSTLTTQRIQEQEAAR